jgi:glycosyltransferase involved in cell wall biosynthesis
VDLGRFHPGRLDATARRARRAEWDADDDTVVVGAVGRLVWEKGYRELFAAASHPRRARARVRFVVVGGLDAAKADQLGPDDLAAAERDADLVSLGHRADVDRPLRRDGRVRPRLLPRGLPPRAAMEAAASGLPVVATDIRGCRQVVESGAPGLVPPRTTPSRSHARSAARRRAGDPRRDG